MILLALIDEGLVARACYYGTTWPEPLVALALGSRGTWIRITRPPTLHCPVDELSLLDPGELPAEELS